jgi:methyl-accepting chemotaxis protein
MTDPKQLEETALKITKAVGSPQSIVVHSFLFLGSFALAFLGYVDFDRMLLLLTTIVSLEAIYLALFIQMTINYQGQAIAEVSADVEEIQEDVEEISEDVGEIQEDVEELQEDVEEISEDVEEMSEDVEELNEEDTEEEKEEEKQKKAIEAIHHDLQRLLIDIEKLKKKE